MHCALYVFYEANKDDYYKKGVNIIDYVDLSHVDINNSIHVEWITYLK